MRYYPHNNKVKINKDITTNLLKGRSCGNCRNHQVIISADTYNMRMHDDECCHFHGTYVMPKIKICGSWK